MSHGGGFPVGRLGRRPAASRWAATPAPVGALLLAVAVILASWLLQQFDTRASPAVRSRPLHPDDTRRDHHHPPDRADHRPPVTTTAARARAKADVKVLLANGAGVRVLGASPTNALKDKATQHRHSHRRHRQRRKDRHPFRRGLRGRGSGAGRRPVAAATVVPASPRHRSPRPTSATPRSLVILGSTCPCQTTVPAAGAPPPPPAPLPFFASSSGRRVLALISTDIAPAPAHPGGRRPPTRS